jgi:hypothetical protein
MPSYDRALHALRSWLDSWSGIGCIAVGTARQGYDLKLTRHDEGQVPKALDNRAGDALDDERHGKISGVVR